VLKVFHFARFDVAAVRHYLGIEVAPLYCTRTASKLIRTYTERHGLKDVVLELLDIELDKAARSTDWASPTSPICDLDTRCCPDGPPGTLLEREGREGWACFRAIGAGPTRVPGYQGLFEH
jgi:hypothetical protein